MTVHKIKGKGNCIFCSQGYGCAVPLCTRIRLFQLKHLRLSMPVELDGHNALSSPHFRLTLPLCVLMNVAFIQHFCWHFPTAEMVLSCFLIVGMGLCLFLLLATKNFSKFQPPEPFVGTQNPFRKRWTGSPGLSRCTTFDCDVALLLFVVRCFLEELPFSSMVISATARLG